MYMPPRKQKQKPKQKQLHKPKPKQKQLQNEKQTQSQAQNVTVNIHEKKVNNRRVYRKKKESQLPLPPPVVLGLPKVPPIVVQYSEPASLTSPAPIPPPPAVPATSNIMSAPIKGSLKIPEKKESAFSELITPSPASTISSGIDWIEPVAEEPRRVPISKNIPDTTLFKPIRSSSDILREAPSTFESLIRTPSSSREELSAIFNPTPIPTPTLEAQFQTPIQTPISGVVASRVAEIENKSKDKTKQARETRKAMQLSLQTGSDITDEQLLVGYYGNIPSGLRRVPTVEQQLRLAKLGKPYIGKSYKKK